MTNPGTGIVRPVVPPRASAQLADSMVQEINPSNVLRRWGIITAVRVDGSVDVDVAGVTVAAVKRYASYNPTVGERVQIDVVDTNMVVVGATAPSPRNQTINARVATITAVKATGLVDVKFDDNQVATNLSRLATYNPTVNDVVQVLQVGNTTTFIVIGPLYGNTQPYLRRPTGDIEISIRKTPKPGTLLLDGSTVLRADYPALFAWVQAQGLLSTASVPNLFGMGNGSTNFVLPDFRNRVLSGADAAHPLGTAYGADAVTLTAAQMPVHTHTATTTVTVAQHPGHGHYGSVDAHPGHGHYEDAAGGHGGHTQGDAAAFAGGAGHLPTFYNATGGSHTHNIQFSGTQSHNLNIDFSGVQVHSATGTTTVANAGNATPGTVPVQQATYAVNYLIWT